MIESSTSKDRRAQLAAIVGSIFQLAFFAVLAVVSYVYQSDVIAAAARWMLGGLLIWPVIALVHGQRRRTAQERLEAEELKRTQQTGDSTAMFDVEDEAYLIERRRLNWMLRWLVPGAAVLLAVYHVIGAFVLWSWDLGVPLGAEQWRLTQESGKAMAFVGGVGFLAFLFSRYTIGMSRVPGWGMLRSGASYLAGNAFVCVLVLLAIGLQGRDIPHPEPIAAYLIRIAFLIVGFEFVANFMLDFYRPRTAGQESRPAFDSRLLSLITVPGGIARSLADAINYQFGFEVSATWFYQLLKRAMLPMVAFGILVLFLLSTVLIIDSDEQAVVERFGRRMQAEGAALGPGLYFKMPWPIDVAYRSRVQQVRSLVIGNTPAEKPPDDPQQAKAWKLRPMLWGEKHEFNAEMMLVVASPELTNFEVDAESPDEESSPKAEGKAVAVGLLMVSVDVQYCVDNIHDYIFEYQSPENVVEAIAYQVLTDYAASVDVDQFIGPGRTEINATLHEILQKRLNELGVGVRILCVVLQEAHPTDDVAKAFQDVVKADREKDTFIENARGEAEVRLTAVAGSRNRAEVLDRAILERDRLNRVQGADAAALAAAEQRVSDLLEGTLDKRIAAAGGSAAQQIAQMRAQVQAELTQSQRDLALFNAELVAFQAAPRLYKVRKYLDMLERSVQHIRKYVVVAHPDTHVIIEFEKKEEGTINIGTE